MKTYKEFLEEKLDTRALRNREFAQKKNQMKPGAPDKDKTAGKGGALVHVPGKGRTEKEATGKFDPRATPKRPPGPSGSKQSTTARMNSKGRQNALALYRKKNKMNPLRKELQKAAGWETGKDTKGSYAARKGVELAKGAAKGAVGLAKRAWNTKTGGSLGVSHGTPIV